MNRLFFVLLITFPLLATAQSFDVKTKKGTANFTYDEKTKGTFGGVSATIQFDLSDLSKGSIVGTVNVSALDTENKKRNKHLKGEDYFDLENYPTMSFSSTSISEVGGVFTIVGKLKIKSTEKEVTFEAVNTDGKLVFTTIIYGSDFDVAVSSKREKTKINVSIVIPF